MLVCSFHARFWFVYFFGWNNYHVDGVTMKIKIAFIFLVSAMLACFNQIQIPSQLGLTPSSDVSLPVKAAASAEPTESPVIYVTTAPLNVRSEASASSQILGVPEKGQVIVIFIPIPEIKGDDCYLGEWYETKWNEVTAYVCSLYIEER